MTPQQSKAGSNRAADDMTKLLRWERPSFAILTAAGAESGGGPQIDNNGLS